MVGVTVESIQAGDGKHYPMKRQTVTVHYVGYLDRNGEHKFDSTWDRGASRFLHLFLLTTGVYCCQCSLGHLESWCDTSREQDPSTPKRNDPLADHSSFAYIPGRW